MTKELEALKRIRQETCPATYMADFDKNECCDVIEQALHRLESIDNANPSEALVRLEQFLNEMTYCLEHPKEYAKGYDKEIFWKYKNTFETTIKQALLKAQEPKHYLKWEDLEFKEETTYENVKMGEHIYELKYWKYKDSYKDFMGNDIYYYEKFVFLRGHQIECTEFFNDLHLERVEE